MTPEEDIVFRSTRYRHWISRFFVKEASQVTLVISWLVFQDNVKSV